MNISSVNPTTNYYIFKSRVKHLIETVFNPILNFSYCWQRIKFQNRGSLHIHCVAALRDDPGIMKLTEEFSKYL